MYLYLVWGQVEQYVLVQILVGQFYGSLLLGQVFGKIGLDDLMLVLIVFWVVVGELVNEDVVIGLVNFFSVWLRIIGLLG